MSKKLVIVESPAKAKTIGKILGADYAIKASMGHIRDLPEDSFGVDIEHDFQPQYEESKSRSKNLSDLKSTAKVSDEIFLASDPDREGEAIAWHLQEVLRKANKKASFHRVSFHEITKSAIMKAFEQPGDVDMNRVDAQQARRVLDRIVGYQISPLLWSRIERGISAGRVQSVALRLVCEREREIQNFQPKEYWTFEGKFSRAADPNSWFHAKLAKVNGKNLEIGNSASANALAAKVRAVAAWHVASVETAPKFRNAAPPFITSTLQQAASSSIGFSASQTMRIAQQLYEGVELSNGPAGLITYMRTDSVAIAVEAQNAARSFIASAYGPQFVPAKPNVYRSKANAQGAHEAIRPTDVTRTPEMLKPYLDPQQFRLYTLIWRRFVASQMAPARLENTVAILENKGGADAFTFRASATVTRFPGFLQVYNIVEEGKIQDEDEMGSTPDEATILAALARNDSCSLDELLTAQKFTEPQPRFSEATLVKELESNGIGRPSTYATIVNTIQVRNYVGKEKGKLVPTDLGFRVNDYLVASLPDLFQVGFTAGMEDQLDYVEEGKVQWTRMLHDFYDQFAVWLQQAKFAGAPENEKSSSLIQELRKIKNWPEPQKVVGRRAFSEERFFQSIVKKFESGNPLTEKQWDALLTIGARHLDELPGLYALAQEKDFANDLLEAETREKEMSLARENRRKKAEAMVDVVPADSLKTVFSALDGVKWEAPEKFRGRTFDDKAFFSSLEKQFQAGKTLSEKQVAALSKIAAKYKTQLKNASAVLEPLAKFLPAAPVISEEERLIQKADAGKLIRAFDGFTGRQEPTVRRGRTFDDKTFVASLAKQLSSGKVLSDKQIAALKKTAAKYGFDK